MWAVMAFTHSHYTDVLLGRNGTAPVVPGSSKTGRTMMKNTKNYGGFHRPESGPKIKCNSGHTSGNSAGRRSRPWDPSDETFQRISTGADASRSTGSTGIGELAAFDKSREQNFERLRCVRQWLLDALADDEDALDQVLRKQAGESNSGISRDYGHSPSTIGRHVAKAMRQLESSNLLKLLCDGLHGHDVPSADIEPHSHDSNRSAAD